MSRMVGLFASLRKSRSKNHDSTKPHDAPFRALTFCTNEATPPMLRIELKLPKISLMIDLTLMVGNTTPVICLV